MLHMFKVAHVGARPPSMSKPRHSVPPVSPNAALGLIVNARKGINWVMSNAPVSLILNIYEY